MVSAIKAVYQWLAAAICSAISKRFVYIHRILILIDLLLEQCKGMLPTNTRAEASPFSVGLAGNKGRYPLLIRLLVDTKVTLAPTVHLPTASQDQVFSRRHIDVCYRLVELNLHRLIDARSTTALVDVEFERRVVPSDAQLTTVASTRSENSPILEEEQGVVLSTRNLDDPGASDFWIEVVDGFVLGVNFRVDSGIALEAKLSPVVQSPCKDSALLEDSEAVEAPSSNCHCLFYIQFLGFHSLKFVTLQNETSDLPLFPSTPCVDVTIGSQCDEVIITRGDGGEMLILDAREFHWSKRFRCNFRFRPGFSMLAQV